MQLEMGFKSCHGAITQQITSPSCYVFMTKSLLFWLVLGFLWPLWHQVEAHTVYALLVSARCVYFLPLYSLSMKEMFSTGCFWLVRGDTDHEIANFSFSSSSFHVSQCQSFSTSTGCDPSPHHYKKTVKRLYISIP